ncbi:MAG: hypothetical protein R6U68_05115 [Desulfobacteraceae bacterium]
MIKKYWTASGKKHRFAVKHKTAQGVKVYTVIRTGAIGIRRYVKIKADANPYLPEYETCQGAARARAHARGSDQGNILIS